MGNTAKRALRRSAIIALVLPLALAGCLSLSSSHPDNPPPNTTVVVPPNNGGTTVVCPNGTQPPCP